MAEEILGNYRMLKHLVTGQTSQVWEVAELTSGRHFALKILLPEKATEAEFRRFLIHEAEVGMLLAHPNIIRILTLVRSKDNPYFVMDFFPAGNLKLRILRREHEFIHERCQNILKQVATGLAFMNAKGWVHRDVKPDNVLVNHAGEVRIIDFALATKIPTGLAKLFHGKGKVQGTRSYMSPEQIRGQPLDGRADIYSFGVMAYELATGRTPFTAAGQHELLTKHLTEKPPSPRSFNPEITEEFSKLILDMLAKKRDERPRDFHEVLMRMRTLKVFQPKPEAREKPPAEGRSPKPPPAGPPPAH